MKKNSLIALALAAATTFGAVGASQAADDSRFSLAVGPAWTSLDGLDNKMSGINVQYKFESKHSRVGLVGGLTHTGHSSKNYEINGIEGSRAKGDFSYTSFTVGPSYRFNKYVALYGQVGVGQVEAEIDEVSIPGYQTVDYTAKDGETSLVYGLGLHLQPDRHLFLNLYYERSGLLVDTDTYSIGLGYMF